MHSTSILASVVLIGCASQQAPSPPGPVALGSPVLLVPVQPIGVETIDEKQFMELLEADDWSSFIDPSLGLVSLGESASEKDPGTHEVSVHRWCGARAAKWAKFEALDLAAGMISDAEHPPCLGFREAPTLAIECHDRAGGLKNFRFVRRGSRFVLNGIATVAEGSISPKDEQRYEEALAAPDRCDPVTGTRREAAP